MAHGDGGVPTETTQVGASHSLEAAGSWEIAFQAANAPGANTQVGSSTRWKNAGA